MVRGFEILGVYIDSGFVHRTPAQEQGYREVYAVQGFRAREFKVSGC